MRLRRICLGMLPLALNGACSACSNGAADAGADSGSDVQSEPIESGPPCTPAPRPSYVPNGWINYDDYAPCSGLYVPADSSQLPTAVNWQACEVAAATAGCRRIQIDWATANELPSEIFIDSDATINTNGDAIILSSREYVDHKVDIVAYPDGNVITAILATQLSNFKPYVFIPPTFSPTKWLLQIKENNSFDTSGYIAGSMSTLQPTTHRRFQGNHTNVVGDLGVLDIASNTTVGLLDFDSGVKLLDIKSPSLPMSFEWMLRDQVFWQGNGGLVDQVGRWTSDGGAIDFISYGLDPNHGAADLGSDATDIVWFDESGVTDGGAHATMSYWTSPYVTSPADLQPRRLRSEAPNTNVGTPIAVGCGRAAFAPLGSSGGLRIVRLADGWSWFLANAAGWTWQQALALTCNEVFARVFIAGPITTMARVAFAQLGSGLAPD